jgi:hypothetical protein
MPRGPKDENAVALFQPQTAFLTNVFPLSIERHRSKLAPNVPPQLARIRRQL